MAAVIRVQAAALDRLAELGLSMDVIETVLQRAEAEAATCTGFDPPIASGYLRYARTVRFLREALVPAGWDYDNPQNFCRTIHPSGQWAVVATSGDEGAGRPDLKPTTKHPKGAATVEAVDMNSQLAFDLGGEEHPAAADDEEHLVTWFLLYNVTTDEIRAELSLPTNMVGSTISNWQERIILPPISRNDPLPTPAVQRDDGNEDEYLVEVNRR